MLNYTCNMETVIETYFREASKARMYHTILNIQWILNAVESGQISITDELDMLIKEHCKTN